MRCKLQDLDQDLQVEYVLVESQELILVQISGSRSLHCTNIIEQVLVVTCEGLCSHSPKFGEL